MPSMLRKNQMVLKDMMDGYFYDCFILLIQVGYSFECQCEF